MENHNPTQKAPSKTYTLRITFNPATQELDTTGPMDNGVLFLGMLEMAKIAYCKMAIGGALPRAGIIEAPPGG